jgi:ATP sulfurylase
MNVQDDDIPGRFRTYEVLKEEVNNPRLRWAYLPYSMHMAGPREAIQHMIIRRNYGTCQLSHMPEKQHETVHAFLQS